MKKKVVLSFILSSVILAQDSFTLGEVSIQDKQEKVLDSSKVTQKQIEEKNFVNVTRLLDSMPSVYFSTQGGRNEGTISIRGFNARQISTYIDGIPIYVPFDGNFDYSRFLTSGLSNVSLTKGFGSIAYGANGMGGSINMVSKKPKKKFEGSVSTQLNLDNEFNYSSYTNTISAGSKQKSYYIQVDASQNDTDHWNLSKSYNASSLQPKGERLKSNSKDLNAHIKLGITPNASSEYVIGFFKVDSDKSQPTITDSTYGRVKYWDWDYWKKDTVYFLANKIFDSRSLKLKIYNDKSKSSLLSYDDNTYSTMIRNSSFKSKYDDSSYGIGVDYTMFDLFQNQTFLFTFNYKRDKHNGYNTNKITGNWKHDEKYEDDTYSIGFEDIYEPNDIYKIVFSLAYDYVNPQYFYDTNSDQSIGKSSSQGSLNPQLGFFYSLHKNDTFRATLSQKSHIPSMKERYSRKLGTAIANTDLKQEIATHFELGYKKTKKTFNYDVAVFYTILNDAIENVYHHTDSSGDDISQNQNVGKFIHTGFETSLNYKTKKLKASINYTYLDITSKNDSDIKITDAPRNKIYTSINYMLFPKYYIGADITIKEGEYQNDSKSNYYKTSTSTTANIIFNYKHNKNFDIYIGANNVTDNNNESDLGFPQRGAEYYAKLAYKF